MGHDEKVEKCLENGGILPEPRSQQENEFLMGLGVYEIILGMNDRETEGTWVWDSDSTPLIYQNWTCYDGNSGTEYNCASMTAGCYWHKIACNYVDRGNNKLICQKAEGLYPSLFYSFFV